MPAKREKAWVLSRCADFFPLDSRLRGNDKLTINCRLNSPAMPRVFGSHYLDLPAWRITFFNEKTGYGMTIALKLHFVYQSLINLYLRDCVASHRKIDISWQSRA